MIKIAYIIQSWYLGGIETGIYNIAKYLFDQYKNTFEFHFIATDNAEIHPRFHSIGSAQYMGRNWGDITTYLKNNKIDILQWGNVSEYAKCGYDAGVPIIIERISGPRSLGKNHSYNSHIISSSDGIVPSIKREWDGDITVIKNGVAVNSKNTINRLGFSDDDFIVVYPAARMGEGQNYQMLIKAVIKSHAKNNKIKLVLMGDHPSHAAFPSIKNKLINMAKPLENDCIFTGFVLEPDPIISSANLCCVPAKAHGISNGLLTAAAYGVPLISTSVGYNKEICIHGINGYMVSVGDVDRLSQYILDLSSSNDLCKKMGQAGKAIISQEFDIITQSKKYKDLYLSLQPPHLPHQL